MRRETDRYTDNKLSVGKVPKMGGVRFFKDICFAIKEKYAASHALFRICLCLINQTIRINVKKTFIHNALQTYLLTDLSPF
jgi:hypothetical protein